MNAKVLCNWLEIPDWPPDHYALLGLKPGEQDAACIERHVHERMAKLRCYQLSYPEEATEGMNRLAQAFICLTEALAKQSYDQTMSGPAAKHQRVENVGSGSTTQATPPIAMGETRQLKPAGTKT